MTSSPSPSPFTSTTTITSTRAIVLAALALVALPAHAVTTRVFVVNDAGDLDDGELEGAMVDSSGRVVRGAGTVRMAIEGESLAYSMAVGPRGDVYVGTGEHGKVLRLRGDALAPFAETGQLLVASLAVGDDGTVYAGTLPEGRIYAITESGTMRELARPEGAEHVWALAYDARRRVLFAATGPQGKIFTVDAQGRVELFHDSRAEHVMSLALDRDGTLYAGTGDDGVVFRLAGPGRVEIAADLPGNEVTALAVRDGVVLATANDLPDPPRPGLLGITPIPGAAATAPAPAASASRPAPSARASSRPRAGKGAIVRIERDGHTETLLERDDTHFTCVAFGGQGEIFAGDGREGRIHRVDAERRRGIFLDLEERQVLAMHLAGDRPVVATGDGAAVYRLVLDRPSTSRWTSKSLDARFVSTWGRVEWLGTGGIRVSTRSGNREEPDDTWSEWSAPIASPARVSSPAARFVQIRVELADPTSALRSVRLYYLPQNQRARVRNVRLKDRARDADEPTTRYELGWDVTNPDEDALRYRLQFRRAGDSRLRDVFDEEHVQRTTSYVWETSAIPDGMYVVRVEASDETANPASLELRDAAESEPIRIDNHAPRIEGLGARGRVVTGRAVDALGPIARLEVAFDGDARFRDVFPEDQLLDAREEAFRVELPATLAPGSHLVAVRATDAAGNAVTAEIEVDLRR